MTRLEFSPEAARDLQDLSDLIGAASGHARARAYLGRLQRHLKTLETFPSGGRPRDEFRPGLRSFGFERRVTIFYVVRPRAILILRILYAGRQFEPGAPAGA